MNISSNPWSFVNGDIASAAAAASPTGMVGNASDSSIVTFTSGTPHGFVVNQFLTYTGDTNGRFNGWYKVVGVPTTTTAILAWLSTPTSGSPPATTPAASGGGTMYVNQVQQMVRIEDISIQWTSSTAPTASLLNITDRNGSVEWTFELTTLAPGLASQNRGKLMWVNGVTIQALPANAIALLTIN